MIAAPRPRPTVTPVLPGGTPPPLPEDPNEPARYTSVAISGNTAFLGNRRGIVSLDISDPNHPQQQSFLATNSAVTSLTAAHDYLFATYAPNTNPGGLQILDIHDITHPQMRGNVAIEGYGPVDVAASGDYAYVVAERTGLQIVDVLDPDAPKLRGRYATTAVARSVQVIGDTAYVTDQGYVGEQTPKSGLQLIDVHNPDQPRLRGTYPLTEGGGAVQVINAIAYITNAPERGLVIVDLSDPLHPVERHSVDMPRTASAVYYAADVTYVIGFGELYTFDIRNPDQPIQLGIYPIAQATDIQIRNTLAYVTVYDQGLYILDVSNPAQLLLRETYIPVLS